MKRLRLLFAFLILLLALPVWRLTDLLAIFSPFQWPLTFSLVIWFGIFIMIPAKLIFPKIKTYVVILSIISYGMLAWWSSPLSKMATVEPYFNHCGGITYTGIVSPKSIPLGRS